eukprot:2558194-Pleurochrysis_carterae.AAC.1
MRRFAPSPMAGFCWSKIPMWVHASPQRKASRAPATLVTSIGAKLQPSSGVRSISLATSLPLSRQFFCE